MSIQAIREAHQRRIALKARARRLHASSGLRYCIRLDGTRPSVAAKLNMKKAQAIRKALAKGKTRRGLARKYGVQPAAISDIHNGRTYQERKTS